MPESIGRRRSTLYAGENLPRPWPPREMLLEMLAEGSDLQIAEMLSRTREEVRWQRQVLGLPVRERGGGKGSRRQQRQQFEAKWATRLESLGLLHRHHVSV